MIPYTRIKIFNKTNGGLSSARNAGLDICTGDYISFIDSDDHIPNNFVSELVNSLEIAKSDLSVCRIIRFEDETNNFIEVFYPFKDGLYESKCYLKKILLHKVDNASWNKLYKREIVGDLRFKVGIINEDIPFVTEYIERCNSISYTNKTSYNYRRRKNSITQIVKPNIMDYVYNALSLSEIVSSPLKSYVKPYLYYETINAYANIISSDNRDSLIQQQLLCRNIIKNNIVNFIFNKNLKIKMKLKYVLCLLSPNISRFIIKNIFK